jgi:hypothetical protein
MSILVVRQVNNAWFVVSALALKLRTKVLTTNLFTHKSWCGGLLVLEKYLLKNPKNSNFSVDIKHTVTKIR